MAIDISKSKKLILMMKNIPVVEFSTDRKIWNVLNWDYLPYRIKGFIKQFKYNENLTEFDNKVAEMDSNFNNLMQLMGFFGDRVLSLDRENGKKIYNLLKLSQRQDGLYRAYISLMFRSVSLSDCYWVKEAGENLQWCDVNLRVNSLNRVVAQVALHGSNLTLNGKYIKTPEISTLGTYAKCWKREDGDLWLYKKGHRGGNESDIEVCVSGLLDKMNVKHIKYVAAKSKDDVCCKCKCMTDDKIGIISGSDFNAYCNACGKTMMNELLKIDSDSVYKMCAVDYLISNTDRHDLNWGLYIENDTNRIIKCHPLYDHNNAFNTDAMRKESGGPYIFTGTTMKEAAIHAVKRCDIRFISKVKKSDFLNTEQYSSFVNRAKMLGLM